MQPQIPPSALRAIVPPSIRRRWDRLAFAQLCEVSARLVAENDDLRDQLYIADDSAEFWRQQSMDMPLSLCAETGGAPGLTQSGQLVVVQP